MKNTMVEIGEKVTITKKDGSTITGTVASVDNNPYVKADGYVNYMKNISVKLDYEETK